MNTDSSTELWGKIAAEWCQFAQTNDYRLKFLMPYTLEKLGTVTEKTILDIGCGDGGYARELAKRGAGVTAIDCASASLVFAQRKAIEENVSGIYLQRNSNNLSGIENNIFDIVLSSMMLMDCEDFEGTIREIARVVKPNGIIFISILHPCFNGKNMEWTHDIAGNTVLAVQNYFYPESWENKIAAYFSSPVIFHHRTLEELFKTCIKYDLVLTDFNEPVPPEELLQYSERMQQLSRIPIFLFLEFKKNNA